MKKIFSLILVIILISTLLSVLVACDDENIVDNRPVYKEEFTYNETHHWREQINGTGTYEYGVHREESGWCKVCKMYYECPNLRFEKVTAFGVTGYEVVEFNELDESEVFLNVEIPKYHQEEGDAEPLPVISIAHHVFNCSKTTTASKIATSIQSIKLNEGLLSIGNHAFRGSSIKELIIPNSVIGCHRNYNNGYGIYAVAYECSDLERVVLGNSLISLAGSNFGYCSSLKEVTFGNSIKEIRSRNFFLVSGIKKAVIPASLISIPEESIYAASADYNQRLVGIFEGSSTTLFLEITEEQLNALIIPAKPRDNRGFFINKEDEKITTYGFSEGWDKGAKIYYVNEWHYNEKGQPVPND